jgi:hypothetical protein
LCKEAYRKPKKNSKSAPNAPRPPRSRRSALLAHPGLTDSTQAGLAPVWPGHALRTGPRASASRLVRQLQGGPKTTSRHAPAARPTCRRSCPPLLREGHRDRGIFGGSPPSRARGRQKWPPCCRRSPRSSQVLQLANLTTAPGSGRIITGRLNRPLCLRK